MAGNPRECKQRAMKCLQLAAGTKDESLKEKLIGLAAAWQSLAKELESVDAFTLEKQQRPSTKRH